jgi:hypothetical protein
LDRVRWRNGLLIREAWDRIVNAYEERESSDFKQLRRSNDGHMTSFRRSRFQGVGNRLQNIVRKKPAISSPSSNGVPKPGSSKV